jgi:large subunit ribosomal protein L24
MKIKKGDKVKVIAGKFKGTIATVQEAIRAENKVIIDGVNVKKRSIKKSDVNSSENFIYLSHPIHVSNVMKVTEEEPEKSAKKTSTKKTKSK